MDDEINIPPEALDAARLAYHDLSQDDPIEAVCLAMLKAWPKSYSLAENDSGVIRNVAVIVLPPHGEAQ